MKDFWFSFYKTLRLVYISFIGPRWGEMGSEICLFCHWENVVWVTGTGIKNENMGM